MATPAVLPTELLALVIEQVSSSHACHTCCQRDLLSLARTSRTLNALATPKIYESVCLRSHGTTRNTNSSTSTSTSTPSSSHDQYERRLQLLHRTLLAAPYVASLVRRLRFAHEEPATAALWASIVALTPNLQVLQGVDTFFVHDDSHTHVADAGTIAANRDALESLRGLADLRQAVVHQEVLPTSLATLLTAWPKLETLVLGDLVPADYTDDADISYASLTRVFQRAAGEGEGGQSEGEGEGEGEGGFPSALRNIYFHDCDLDYSIAAEREGLLTALPPLERLGVEYSLGFSLSGISSYLSASALNASTLHTLDFHRQLRSRNHLSSITTMLSLATGLKRLSLELLRYPGDAPDEDPLCLLASASLEELRWVPTYVYYHGEAFSGEDEFNALLVHSITRRAMPALQQLVVGHLVSARGNRDAVTVPTELFPLYDDLLDLADRGYLVNVDAKPASKPANMNAAQRQAHVPRLKLEPCDAKVSPKSSAVAVAGGKERVSGLKRGLSHDGVRRAPVCERPGPEGKGVKDEDVAVGKEEMWGAEAQGDLLGLWVHGRR